MRKNSSLICLLIAGVSFLLSGCVVGNGPGVESIITGEATMGHPLAGMVTVRDSSVPSRQIMATTRADGGYSIDVSGLKAPFTIEASGLSGGISHTLHTVVNGTGVVNINPLTEVAVAGAAEGDTAETVFNSFEQEKLKKVGDGMPKIFAALGSNLKPLFNGFGITFEESTGLLNASNESLQALFTSVGFIHSNGTLLVVNKTTSSVIFFCRINDINGGKFTAANMPPIPKVPAA
ncbi:MAG: hypothetical protein ACOYL3_22770 [Desulfuromonadaceae bacterium]